VHTKFDIYVFTAQPIEADNTAYIFNNW
jgi:hypothetical protein